MIIVIIFIILFILSGFIRTHITLTEIKEQNMDKNNFPTPNDNNQEYIKLNEFYSSNDYIIITEQEGDYQKFVIKRRK